MTEIIPTPQTLDRIEGQPIDQNPAAVYLAGLSSERSKRTQKQALDVIAGLLTGNADAASLAWGELRFQHTQAIRAKLAAAYAPATVNRMLSALRGTLEAAWNLQQISGEDYYRARNVKNVIGETIPAGRDLTPGEISGLKRACEDDPSPAGIRDKAIIGLAYTCGLRRAELVALDLADYEPETERLVIRGKRNKQRTAYVREGAKQALDEWLEIRGEAPGAMFFPINKGGSLQTRRMTNQAIYNLMQKRREQASLKDFSPHDLRRTFVGDLLDAGADISTVQKMAGHASPTTTARYDRRGERTKQKAAGLLHF